MWTNMKPEQFHATLQILILGMDGPFSDYQTRNIDFAKVYDYLMGQVIQGLIEDGKEETAAMMLSCRLELEVTEQRSGNSLRPTIHGPVSILKQLQERHTHYDETTGYMAGPYNVHLDTFHSVLSLVVGPKIKIDASEYIRFQAEVVSIPAEWRTELLGIVRKRGATNQGLFKGNTSVKPVVYQNLYFRSQSEVKIAQALDRHKVMYFANCTAGVNQGQDRINREPDFLICDNRKWGR